MEWKNRINIKGSSKSDSKALIFNDEKKEDSYVNTITSAWQGTRFFFFIINIKEQDS